MELEPMAVAKRYPFFCTNNLLAPILIVCTIYTC